MLRKTEEAAAQLNVAVSTLEAWRVRGGGPEYVKFGKAVRYSDEGLDKFVASRTRTSTSNEKPKN